MSVEETWGSQVFPSSASVDGAWSGGIIVNVIDGNERGAVLGGNVDEITVV